MQDAKSTVFLYDALILAGGKASRMAGRDKGWVMWCNQPLIEHVIQRVENQTIPPQRITISANRNLDAYGKTGHHVLSDERQGAMGPLAGIESALIRCKQSLLLVTPCDMPLIPLDTAERLHAALLDQPDAQGSFAITEDGPQPLCCLLRPHLSSALSRFLDLGHGKVTDWFSTVGVLPVNFKDTGAFINFNDLNMLQAMEAQQ